MKTRPDLIQPGLEVQPGPDATPTPVDPNRQETVQRTIGGKVVDFTVRDLDNPNNLTPEEARALAVTKLADMIEDTALARLHSDDDSLRLPGNQRRHYAREDVGKLVFENPVTGEPIDFEGDPFKAFAYVEKLRMYPNRSPWEKPSDKDN